MDIFFYFIIIISVFGICLWDHIKKKGMAGKQADTSDKTDITVLYDAKTAPYSVFRKNDKCGLIYSPGDAGQTTVLPAKYDAVRVDYKDQNIEALFSSKEQYIKKYGLWIMEDGFQAVTADGKCGLLHLGKLFTGLAYNRIIKLSFRHYLCMNDDRFSIIFFNACGYEGSLGSSFYFQGETIVYEPPLGMTKVLDLLSRHSEKEAQSLLELVKPDGQGNFISQYNHFTAWIDDIDTKWAVQRQIIEDDFNMKALDIAYC